MQRGTPGAGRRGSRPAHVVRAGRPGRGDGTARPRRGREMRTLSNGAVGGLRWQIHSGLAERLPAAAGAAAAPRSTRWRLAHLPPTRYNKPRRAVDPHRVTLGQSDGGVRTRHPLPASHRAPLVCLYNWGTWRSGLLSAVIKECFGDELITQTSEMVPTKAV